MVKTELTMQVRFCDKGVGMHERMMNCKSLGDIFPLSLSLSLLLPLRRQINCRFRNFQFPYLKSMSKDLNHQHMLVFLENIYDNAINVYHLL